MPFHSRTSAFACAASAGVVLVLAALVTFSAHVVALDAALANLAHTGQLAALAVDVSALAGTDLVMPITAVAVIALLLTRHWHGALTLTLAVLGTQAVVQLVKLTVDRPRPALNGAMTEAHGASFPSAHSATAVALYATLALLLAHRCHGRARVAVLALGGAVVAAVGLSRIELGAHYPIDVLAGWLTGAALVLAFWTLVARLVARPLARPA
jgi:undecaprenyl-diphosphatase